MHAYIRIYIHAFVCTYAMLHTRHTHTFIALIVLHSCINTYIHTYVYTLVHVHAFFSQASTREQVCATTKFWNIYIYICIFFHTYPDTHSFFPFSLLAFFFLAGVPREQIFVTTKLWTLQGDADYEGTLAALASASLSLFLFSFLFFLSQRVCCA